VRGEANMVYLLIVIATMVRTYLNLVSTGGLITFVCSFSIFFWIWVLFYSTATCYCMSCTRSMLSGCGKSKEVEAVGANRG
jgi:hypothetical protein